MRIRLLLLCLLVTSVSFITGSELPHLEDSSHVEKTESRRTHTSGRRQAVVDLNLALGIGHEYGSDTNGEVEVPIRLPPPLPRIRRKRYAGDRMRRPIQPSESSHSQSDSYTPASESQDHRSRNSRLSLSMSNDVQESVPEEGEQSHCSATHEEEEEKKEAMSGYRRDLPDGTVAWVPTKPMRMPNGRTYAGWYDTANAKEKTQVAKYLEVKWGYKERNDSMKQTRRRMRERIGEVEAKHLLEVEDDPDLAEAIANSTASNRRYSLNGDKGKKAIKSLQQDEDAGPSKVGKHTRKESEEVEEAEENAKVGCKEEENDEVATTEADEVQCKYQKGKGYEEE